MNTSMKLNVLAAAVSAGITGMPLVAQAGPVDLLFTRGGEPEARAPRVGVVQTQVRGVTQLRLGNGATASFVDAVRYRINDDDSIDMLEGAVTVSAGRDREVLVRMPGGLVARMDQRGGAASFNVREGESRGHVMSGRVRLESARGNLLVQVGQFWAMRIDAAPERVIAMGAQAAPAASAEKVADIGTGGVVAAAENGMPVTFAAGLAAAGASADLVAAANRIEKALINPNIRSFPSGDFALLIGQAARVAAGYGDRAFPGAAADIVRTYLGYLAKGGSGADFLAVYSRIMLQYLDVLRISAAPAGYSAAQLEDIRNFIAYQSRVGGFAGLGASNRILVEAYWSFLQSGGDPAKFGVAYTDLVSAYFAYIRGGGVPANFAAASQQTLNAYIKFLGDSGLLARLSASDKVLLQAYLQGYANGGDGLAFITQYRQALSEFYLWIEAGNLPSTFRGVSAADLRAYLELLDKTGLWNIVLADRASFYREYLAYIQVNADADLFPGLAAFSPDLYAKQLNAYYAFLAQGGLPSAYNAQDLVRLNAYLRVLIASGKLDVALGEYAAFFRAYYEFVAAGNDPSRFTQLPLYVGYANAINAYYAYIAKGGLPSAYTALSASQLRVYVDALAKLGWWGSMSDVQVAFVKAYFAYLATGADPDLYRDLPSLGLVHANYTAAINAYLEFLAKGGLPSAYGTLDAATLQKYIAALIDAGKLDALFGEHAAFLRSYYSFVAAGNDPSRFTGLPIYASYVTAIEAYYTYINNGGVPSAYTALTQEQLKAYMAALANLNWWGTLGTTQIAFLQAYYSYLAGGGAPDQYGALPSVIAGVHASYQTAINAYIAFLKSGGLPSAYTALDAATLQKYIAALIDAGKLDALFGEHAAFLRSYYSFVAAGNDPSRFTGLPIYASYVTAIQAYIAYIDAGGVPSAYTALSQEQVRAYLAALTQLGWWGSLSSTNVSFLTAYYTYLANGGSPDGYSGLPSVNALYVSYASAITAYVEFLRKGGLPSAYTALDAATLQKYIAALIDAGKLDALFGDNAVFLRSYYSFVAAGNDPSRFTQLPIYASYVTAIEAYYTYINNGGVPSAYTALTQEQIKAYMAALANLNWWGTLGTTQIAFLQAYYSYLAGGGAPDQYGALPSVIAGVHASYQTAINAYIAFLQSGGLPSAYTALDAATLQKYIAALIDAGKLDALFGDNAVFLRSYYSFVAAGNDPSKFTGLPIYASYVTAIQAYYVYLNNGGVPTAYTGLTQEQIKAYLAALANLNWWGTLDSTQVTFLQGYYTYLAGGGSPNGYTGLPSNNPPAPSPTTIQVRTAYAMNRTGSGGGAMQGNSGLPKDMKVVSGGAPYEGVPTIASIIAFTPGSGTVYDHQSTDRVTVGRIGNTTVKEGGQQFVYNANQGVHYAYVSPVTAMPTTGTIRYDLAAATKPTWTTSNLQPGTFTGSLAIAFGTTQWRAAAEGSIAMPGDATYGFATAGGLAGVASLGASQNSNPTRSMTATLTGTGRACSAGAACQLNMSLILGGSAANAAALSYFSTGGTDNFVGTAGFHSGGAYVPPTTTVDMAGFAGKTLAGYQYVGTETGVGTNLRALPGTSVSADSAGLTAVGGAVARSTGTVIQAGAIGEVIAWSRWSSGWTSNVNIRYPQAPLDVMVWKPATAIPTSGLVTYKLVGGLDPTWLSNPSKRGTLTGSAAVSFGSAGGGVAKVGFDLLATFSDTEKYALVSTGGVAAPSGFVYSSGFFDFSAQNCAGGNICNFQGGIAGTGASHIGMLYTISNAQNTQLFRGYAAFGKDNSASTPATPVDMAGFANKTVMGYRMLANETGVIAGQIGSVNNTVLSDAQGINNISDGMYARGTGSVLEAGALTDVVAWSRWSSGWTTRFGRSYPSAPFNVIVYKPATVMPASGAISYKLLGGLKPIMHSDPSKVGQLVGSAVVSFGATVKVGFDLLVTFSDTEKYAMTTTGGLTAPSAIVNTTPGSSNPASFAASAGCGNDCLAQLTGGIAGAGASHIALSFIASRQSNGQGIFSGNAAFGIDRAVDLPGATAVPGIQGAIAPAITAIAPVPVPATVDAPVRDWNRWEARNLRGGEAIAALPTVGLPVVAGNDAAAGAGEPAAAGVSQAPPIRGEVISQVERMFGGTLTFQR